MKIILVSSLDSKLLRYKYGIMKTFFDCGSKQKTFLSIGTVNYEKLEILRKPSNNMIYMQTHKYAHPEKLICTDSSHYLLSCLLSSMYFSSTKMSMQYMKIMPS